MNISIDPIAYALDRENRVYELELELFEMRQRLGLAECMLGCYEQSALILEGIT